MSATATFGRIGRNQPTYRIDPEHCPGESFEYVAVVVRLSDNMPVKSFVGDSALTVVTDARDWVTAQAEKRTDLQPVYLDDEGNPTHAPSVPEPQSVRA